MGSLGLFLGFWGGGFWGGFGGFGGLFVYFFGFENVFCVFVFGVCGVCVYKCVLFIHLRYVHCLLIYFTLNMFGVPGGLVRLRRFWGPKSRAKEHDTNRNLTRYRVGGCVA